MNPLPRRWIALAGSLVLTLGAPLFGGGFARAQEAGSTRESEANPATANPVRPDPAAIKPRPEPSKAPSEADRANLDDWVKALQWRSIGPANMGGRIVALSVFEDDPTTFWVATAGGGLLKTVNNGITFEHQFDREASVSIGDVCVAPSDRNVVWVGTGENNPRNSVSYGDGVYKSSDGGKTWKNVGLDRIYQVGRIAVHPKDPNTVYVGSLGRLWGPSEDRGLYKTTDGGTSWFKILTIDDKTGVIDLRMHPNDPETLLVATYERQRDGFDGNDPEKKWGPGGGLYKTTDGGKTFRKLTKGLPSCQLGRIGLDYWRKDPNTVFAIVESEKIGMGPPQPRPGNTYLGLTTDPAEDKVEIRQVAPGGPAEKAGLKPDDLIVALDERPIKTYSELTEQINAHKPGDKAKVRVTRAGETIEAEIVFAARPAGGPQGQGPGQGQGQFDPTHPFSSSLGGQRENIQDRQGADGFQYGGIYKSTDGGESWTRINSLNPRPMYFSQVRVDPNDDRYVYVAGVSLYRSKDGGKTFTSDGGRRVHADQHALWIDPRDGRHMIVGCDGGTYVTYDRMDNWDHLNHSAIGQFYHVALDTRRDYRVYGGLQDNGSWGGPSLTRTRIGPVNEDWIRVGGGDGFKCQVDPNDPDQIYYTSQNGSMGRRNLRTGETAPIRPQGQGFGQGQGRGQAQTQTQAQGQGQTQGQGQGPGGRGPQTPRSRFNWNTPFILSHHNSRVFYCAGDRVFRSLDRGNDLRPISKGITRTDKGSATALTESPRNPDVLYVGTDDGALWVTRDGGKEWVDLVKNVGLPGPRWVATIEASRFEEGRAYVCFDGHRSDDDEPSLFVTEDFGKTWKSIRANLPTGPTRCLREDLTNAKLLYVGTEFGIWASIDRGGSWTKINNNLPTVAVFDLALHPTAGELVAATHGRSLWVLDVTPLRQLSPELLAERTHLFHPTSVVRWRTEPERGQTNRRFEGQNPTPGAAIYYSLTRKADKLSLTILDYEGKVIRTLNGPTEPGLHRIAWDLSRPSPTRPGQGQEASQGEARRVAGAGAGRPEAESETPENPGAGPAAAARPFGRGFGRGAPVPPGSYRLVLNVDGNELTQGVRVEQDPSIPLTEAIADEEAMDEDELMDAEEEEEGDEARGEDIDL
jgi:photosystem II stability/assembly factor-like uncharacterized protein